jgi:hypothetical protein
MRQFSPPLFQATSFYSNIIKLLSNSMNITKINVGTLPDTDRPWVVAEANTLIENIKIFGHSEPTIEIIHRALAIKGDVVDYALIATDYTLMDAEGKQRPNNEKLLAALMESFRFLRRPSEEEKRQILRIQADKDFEKLIDKNRENIFKIQTHILNQKLHLLNLDSGSGIDTALEYITSLAELANYLKINNDLAGKLRQAVTLGKNGNLGQIKIAVFQIRKAVKTAEQRGRGRKPSVSASRASKATEPEVATNIEGDRNQPANL